MLSWRCHFVRRSSNPWRYLGLCGLCCLLMSCAGEPVKSLFVDYRTRLARTLDIPSPPVSEVNPLIYPNRRSLSFELTPIKVDILEFLRLSQCELQRLVGERNASLGQVMSHSQRWLYEARFLHQSQQCLQQLLRQSSQVRLQKVLQDAIAIKQTERRQVTWNATFGSREFQHLFSVASGPLALHSEKPSELIDALRQLRWSIHRWHQLDQLPTGEVEQLYQVLGADRWLGQLAHSLVLINNELQALNQIQQQRLSGRPLCFQGRRNRSAEAMHGVFLKYYIGQVQPYLAAVSQHARLVLNELESLRQLSYSENSDIDNAFNEYWLTLFASEDFNTNTVNPVRSQRQEFERLLAQHTKNWQQQLQQCGLMPGT